MPAFTLGLAGAGQGSTFELGRKNLNFHIVSPASPHISAVTFAPGWRGRGRRGGVAAAGGVGSGPSTPFLGPLNGDSDGAVFPILPQNYTQ